jgi:four helix bundle protein
MGARHHTDLEVWGLANEVRDRVLTLISSGQFDGQRWLREQLARASQSACANVAEGFARYQPRDFARFLRGTKGSLIEVEEHLHSALQSGLISELEFSDLSALVHRAAACATRLIRYLEKAKAP